MKLTLPSPVLNVILEHCRREAPREAVGLLATASASNLVIGAVAMAHNRSSTPEVSFYVDPHEQWRIETALEEAGMPVIGSYHSHPTKDAQPSGMDCEFMGDRIMMIIGLRAITSSMPPDIRAWRAVDGVTEEVELDIMPMPNVEAVAA